MSNLEEKNELYYLKLMNNRLRSVKNNVQFFAWLLIANIALAIVWGVFIGLSLT